MSRVVLVLTSPRLFRPLRHRSFAGLFLGQLLSGMGDGAFTVVLILALARIDPSGRTLGMVLSFQVAGGLLALAVGGPLIDKVGARKVMIGADASRAGACIYLAIAVPSNPWVLGAAAVSLSVGAAFFRPAYSALVPEIVSKELLQEGNALRTLARRSSLLLGPVVGGLVWSADAPALAYWLDAASFLVSLVFVARASAGRARRAHGSGAVEGARYILRDPMLRWVIASGAAQMMLVVGPITVLFPILQGGAEHGGWFGTFIAARAAGTIGGVMVLGVRGPRAPSGQFLLLSGLLMLPLAMMFSLRLPVGAMLVTNIVYGLAQAPFLVIWPSVIQRLVPRELLGRVFSADELGSSALLPLGLAIAPTLYTLFGAAGASTIVSCALIASCVLPLGSASVRRLGRE